jgi:hypothetical protein
MSKTIDLVYNSNKEILKISEYGRNVQNLVNYCKTIKDDNERQQFAQQIVSLMWQMRPQTGPREDARRKFWTHLMMIADYELDIKIPEGVDIRLKEQVVELDKMTYPSRNRNQRQYGQFVQRMIAKAATMEDEEMRNQYLRVIGSFMKIAYRNWSRENYINDEVIIADLVTLANGRFEVPSTLELDKVPIQNRKKHQRSGSNNNRKKQTHKNHRSKSYSSNRRRR